jgi:hypothetical protein
MRTNILLNTISNKYGRANTVFTKYIYGDNYFTQKNLDLELVDFNVFKTLLYSFFESQKIFVTVKPYELKDIKWSYLIEIDDNEISDGNYKEKEVAEYIAFLKCFQFLDTRLFIEQTKNRYYDESADVACLNVNWKHLNKVLNYKRKYLL